MTALFAPPTAPPKNILNRDSLIVDNTLKQNEPTLEEKAESSIFLTSSLPSLRSSIISFRDFLALSISPSVSATSKSFFFARFAKKYYVLLKII